MYMLCPHCQVKGKVKDELIGKKVRCPKCEEIFIVEAIAEVNIDSLPTTETADSPDNCNLPTCSNCGFAFNEEFMTTIGEEKLCSVCAS